MASTPAYAVILLSLPFLAAAVSPAPSPAALPNPVEILAKDGRFSTLLELLTKAKLVQPLLDQLNTPEGLTIFPPTNDAFKKISATLAKLSEENKTTILTYHALTKYVSFGDLDKIGNPVDTFAEGLTLNFTGGNVVTGVVTTKVGTPLYDKSPLGIFPVEDVLIPPTFAPAPPPKASGPSSPPPFPEALPNPIKILEKAGRFSILIDLLSKTGVVYALRTQVNSSTGISFLAPTDDAFKKISATLAKLSEENKTTILTYHALIKYVSFGDLDKIGNPVETFANGLTLNFTGGNVVTGVVRTKVRSPLYDTFPLGIFPVEDVLIPPTFALAPPPKSSGPSSPPPKASGPNAPPPIASGPNAPPAEVSGPSAPPVQSAASSGRLRWGAVAGAAFACMSFF